MEIVLYCARDINDTFHNIPNVSDTIIDNRQKGLGIPIPIGTIEIGMTKIYHYILKTFQPTIIVCNIY